MEEYSFFPFFFFSFSFWMHGGLWSGELLRALVGTPAQSGAGGGRSQPLGPCKPQAFPGTTEQSPELYGCSAVDQMSKNIDYLNSTCAKKEV